MADRLVDVDRIRAHTATTPAPLFGRTDAEALLEHIDWLQSRIDERDAADAFARRYDCQCPATGRGCGDCV